MFMILFTTGIHFRKVLLCLQISVSEREVKKREVKAGIKDGSWRVGERRRERERGADRSSGADQ